MKKYLSKSAAETKAIGAKLAKEISHGVIALSGELGVGKTTFAQGFAKGLGIKEKIISPTFVFIRQHSIPQTDRMLFHIDLYRLENETQVENLGLEELLNNSNHLILIEWAEKMNKFFPSEIEKHLPKDVTLVSFKRLNGNQREIIIR